MNNIFSKSYIVNGKSHRLDRVSDCVKREDYVVCHSVLDTESSNNVQLCTRHSQPDRESSNVLQIFNSSTNNILLNHSFGGLSPPRFKRCFVP